MSKRKNTTAPTTPTNTNSGVLSLATLNDLDTPQRVELYVATESKQRLGFLLQGKILFTLGDEGLELLRAAGIEVIDGVLARIARGESFRLEDGAAAPLPEQEARRAALAPEVIVEVFAIEARSEGSPAIARKRAAIAKAPSASPRRASG